MNGVAEPVASVEMTGHNVGDLLNAKGISWGWFYGHCPVRLDRDACSLQQRL